MAPERPLLTIAIPTYNRCDRLEIALRALMPQLEQNLDVEVLISDNCSPGDKTAEMVGRFVAAAGGRIRSQRHETNIGPDRNFISCYEGSRGRYFWLCGDDDIILEGGLTRVMQHLRAADYDLVFATSCTFRDDPAVECMGDRMGRNFHVFTDTRRFVRTVNIMFTFISGIIVNKERLDATPHEQFSAYIGTHLVQLSWVLPLLRTHRRSLALWQRVVAGRGGEAGGYSFGQVFGETLVDNTTRLLPDRPELARVLIDTALRGWFPNMIYELRHQKNRRCGMDEAPAILSRSFGGNFRYWLFVYPAIVLPLPLARIWVRAGGWINKGLNFILLPGFWRKEIKPF